MIVVTVTLQSAVTGRETLLGRTIISNVGGTAKLGDYDVRVGRKPDAADLAKVYQKPLRRGEVKAYPRLAYNVWRLVIRALLDAFPEEKG